MIKNSELPQELRELNKLFSKFDYKFDASVLFDDFLTIVICCMGKGTNEKLYFETIKKYSEKELFIFAQMFAQLASIYTEYSISEQWCDPLGDFYEALASKYKKSNLGQFFTPKPICDLMAAFILNADEWGKNINEPCSGSGRNVLAANQVVTGNYYICEDIDPICCKMTAINLCFHNIRGEVHCRDVIAYSEPRFSFVVNYEIFKNKSNTIFMYPPL